MRAARGTSVPLRTERGSSVPSSINDDVFTDSEGGNDAPRGRDEGRVREDEGRVAVVREDEVDYRGVDREEDVHLAATEELLGRD